MFETFLYWLLSFPYRAIDFCARRGDETTDMDVLNELHPQEWKTTQEVADGISQRKREGKWISISTNADCHITLIRFKQVGWVKQRKRANGPFLEFVLTGDGIKQRYSQRELSSEGVGETAKELG